MFPTWLNYGLPKSATADFGWRSGGTPGRKFARAEPGEAACHYASAKFWADSHREQALVIFVAM